MGGARRITVQTEASVEPRGWDWETAEVAEAWPYLGPTWIAATEKAMPEARPWHTCATRGRGEEAYLPGFILDSPPAVDFDPRTYLGWQPPTGEEVCCGVQTCSDTVQRVQAWGPERLFPTLLLGSPLGYRTEAAFTFWTPALFPGLVDAAVQSAAAAGARTVIAPWVPDRMGNQHLTAALQARGAVSTFWGVEDYLRLGAGSYDEHIAGLPAKKRRRVKEDLDRCAAAGVTLHRVVGADVARLVPRIAELTCLNRAKNGGGEEPQHITTMLFALLDAGADVRCHVAIRGDADPRTEAPEAAAATLVTIRKGRRLFIKWAGFDYAALGDRSGVYFALVLDAPVREAYAEGLRFVECGAGAHQAKVLRGCEPRQISTAVLAIDPALQQDVAPLVADFGERRREAFGLAPARGTLPVLDGTAGGCCAGG
jgi:hypothetical protein